MAHQLFGRRSLAMVALTIAAIAAAGSFSVLRWRANHFVAALLEQARDLYDRGDWPGAERLARAQLKIDRDDQAALRLLARTLFRQQNDALASSISARLKKESMTAEDYFLLGQASVRSQQVDLAIKSWQQAEELDPDHFEARAAREQTLYRLDRLSEAATEAKALIAQPGHEAVGELMRGQIFVQLSQPADAVDSFVRAFAQKEQWTSMVDPLMVRKHLVRSMLQTGRAAAARQELLRIPSLERDPETCWLLVRCDLQQSLRSDQSLLAASNAYRRSHPVEPEPAPYVGEGRCAGCHAEISREQSKSRHARTFDRKTQAAPIPFPREPIADPVLAHVSHAFEKTSARLEVETRSEGVVYRTVVKYAFGSGDRGLTLVGRDGDGRSLECRLSFYPDQIGWDVTSGQSIDPHLPPASFPGRLLTDDEVRNCMECHVTNPRSIVTGAGAEASDRAIGCEKCHGPGGHHLQAVASPGAAGKTDFDLAIARPGIADGAGVVGLCAQCHSPRRNGELLDPQSSGSIRFQGSTLTKSRCYIESGLTLDCVTCHDPHRDLETSMDWYESKCLQCHGRVETVGDQKNAPSPSRSTSSCPVRPTSGCIACHMPKTATTMAHTAFTDHCIRIHREPDLRPKRPS
jgi:tetratricopeptide (TPR) repeat protein